MPDNISPPTPEGEENRCPICQSALRPDPSLPCGGFVCPNCGAQSWFDLSPSDERIVDNFNHWEGIACCISSARPRGFLNFLLCRLERRFGFFVFDPKRDGRPLHFQRDAPPASKIGNKVLVSRLTSLLSTLQSADLAAFDLVEKLDGIFSLQFSVDEALSMYSVGDLLDCVACRHMSHAGR